MVRVAFILICGFIFGAVVIENKQHFSKSVAIPVAFLPDGGHYDGELLKGELSGSGRISWPNGHYYEGEFREGLYHGFGRYETAEFVYEGEFVKGVAKGEGKITFANGNIYQGHVDHGQANGQGRMTMDGSEYLGEFSNNHFYGQGKLIYGNGDSYEGDFVDGLFNGSGLLTRAEGKIYKGHFVDGVMSGRGDYRDGMTRYTGEFQNSLFEGEGIYQKGNVSYEGHFHQGEFDGNGIYIEGTESVIYKGAFVKGAFHGQGILEVPGWRYEGGFEYGLQHGQGVIIYDKPLDGISRVEGRWEYGQLLSSNNPLVESDDRVIVEDVLYRQQARVDQAINQLAENDPAVTEMYFVGIAGDGAQGVFRREVNFVRSLFDRNYGTESKSSLLINGNVSYQDVPLATVTSIERVLQGTAAKMDAENDILFIYLTSHGSSDFQFQLQQQGLSLAPLSAKQMGDIIHSLPVRYKVVVISACYSGGYVGTVKDDNTLVIVAASADKTSFGCSDTAEMTYFGEAFFKDALPLSAGFVDAFDRARDIIRGREAKEGYENSHPLIYKPLSIRLQLAKWQQELEQYQQQQKMLIE
jgi:hypothetical protein